ncbi:MAG: protein kinase [Planctomycetota bacterium]
MSEERNVNIGILAVQAGLITSAQLAEAIEETTRLKADGKESSLRDILIKKGFLTEQQAHDLMPSPSSGSSGTDDGTVKMKLEEDISTDEFEGAILGGDFRIEKKLGSGGMGAVYLAEQVSLQRKVALKLISPEAATDQEYVARFKREATSAAQLVHPNIVQVHSIGEHEGLWYIAMEYVAGKSVGDMLKERNPMDVAEAANYIAQALKGLARAHSLGIIHRDIKPDNLMVNSDGEVKIADFGLARMKTAQDISLTVSGAVMGTPHYMSPQQAEGEKLNQQADIYSLGATFYHMVTGATPFAGDSAMSVLYKAGTSKAELPYKRNPAVPIELSRLIMKMMARDLEARYATCEDVLKDLNTLGYIGETIFEARRRRSIPVIAGGTVTILLIIGIGLYFTLFDTSNPSANKPAIHGEPKEPLPPGDAPKQIETPATSKITSDKTTKPAAEPPAPRNIVAPPVDKPEQRGGRQTNSPVQAAPPVPRPLPETPPSKPEPKPAIPKPEAAATKPERGPKSVKPIEPPKPSPIAAPTLPPLPQAKKGITVNAGGGGDFKTLMEAVASLPPELKEPVRIDVHPGIYQGPIKIGGDTGMLATKDKCIHIQAVGKGPVILKAGAEKTTMFINRTDFVAVEGIIFHGSGGSRGINILRSNFFRIRGCVFADCEEGVSSYTGSPIDGKGWWAECSDCLFMKNRFGLVLDDATEIVIRNNAFMNNKDAAIRLYRFRGNVLLNIFSLPDDACAFIVEGGTKLTGGAAFSTKMSYNCYAGRGDIYRSGAIQIKEMDHWRLRYPEFDDKSFRGEPGFRDAKMGDFRLTDSSRCKVGLPEETPMGMRWTSDRWQSYLEWQKEGVK